jgi:hypothetical protein
MSEVLYFGFRGDIGPSHAVRSTVRRSPPNRHRKTTPRGIGSDEKPRENRR